MSHSPKFRAALRGLGAFALASSVFLALAGSAWAQDEDPDGAEDGAAADDEGSRDFAPVPRPGADRQIYSAPVVEMPRAQDGPALGQSPLIEISTPPPEAGAVEFDPGATGLIRTDTFEVAPEPEGAASGAPELHLDGPYQGIVPGRTDSIPERRRLETSKRPLLTWVGFRPTGNGVVFLQLSQPVAFNIAQVASTEYVLDLQGARLATRAEGRRLDTSPFPGGFASVQARNHRGVGVRVTLKLKRSVRPKIRQEPGYVFVELP